MIAVIKNGMAARVAKLGLHTIWGADISTMFLASTIQRIVMF